MAYKVFVYESLEKMAEKDVSMYVEDVEDVAKSIVGGWALVLDGCNLFLPADVCLYLEETEEES